MVDKLLACQERFCSIALTG